MSEDDMRDVKADEAPADWPKAGALSRALAWCAWNIRKKNRAARANGGARVPLD